MHFLSIIMPRLTLVAVPRLSDPTGDTSSLCSWRKPILQEDEGVSWDGDRRERQTLIIWKTVWFHTLFLFTAHQVSHIIVSTYRYLRCTVLYDLLYIL